MNYDIQSMHDMRMNNDRLNRNGVNIIFPSTES